MEKKKGCWAVGYDLTGDEICGVVAESGYQAKSYYAKEYGEGIKDLHIKKMKGDFSDQPIGVLDTMVGLERGVYGFVEGEVCPICDKDGLICSRKIGKEYKIGCNDCLDKLEEAPIPPAPKREAGIFGD
jgi:hypothetical protein